MGNNTLKEADVRTTKPAADSQAPRMPHERDESDDSQASAPRDDMLQAYKDIENGQMDTDCREGRGVENVAGDKRGQQPCTKPGSKVVNPLDRH